MSVTPQVPHCNRLDQCFVAAPPPLVSYPRTNLAEDLILIRGREGGLRRRFEIEVVA
jgi:hypothetical protein